MNAMFDVSTHAPLRGATNFLFFAFDFWYRFNPRTPAGCDSLSQVLEQNIEVSTHAPLRGATSEYARIFLILMFQPTHPCGVRQ